MITYYSILFTPYTIEAITTAINLNGMNHLLLGAFYGLLFIKYHSTFLTAIVISLIT